MLELEPEGLDDGIRHEARAPDERVGTDLLARLERDAGGRHRGDRLSDKHLDAAVLERLLGVRAKLLLEHREDLGAGLDQDDAGVLCGRLG